MTERLKFFRLRKTPYRERKKFRHSVIYALHHRDFMQTSRRPPRSAIFGPKACGFHGNGHLSPRDRNVDVFDEHRESTNGDISVPLLLISLPFGPLMRDGKLGYRIRSPVSCLLYFINLQLRAGSKTPSSAEKNRQKKFTGRPCT